MRTRKLGAPLRAAPKFKPKSLPRINPREISSTHKFDDATGQVYSETITAMQSSDDRDWAFASKLVVGKFRGRELGSRSLQDATIECILQNITDITLEAIECLPERLVRRLWDAINSRCTMCFITWSIFSKVLRWVDNPTVDLLTFVKAFGAPRSPLHVYTTVLNSPSFDFITSLLITAAFPIQDILKLSDLKNLGVLAVSGASVTDYLVREWSRCALEDGAFSVLRILRLWGHEELTSHSFNFIHAFPALAVYDVRGPRVHLGPTIKRQLRRHGWAIDTKGDANEALNETRQTRISSVIGEEVNLSQEQMVENNNGSNAKRIEGVLGVWDILSFCKIGKLRSDCDLDKAGVNSGDSVIIGKNSRFDSALSISVPLVSLHLGPLVQRTSSTPSSQHFVIIRIVMLPAVCKAPPADDETEDEPAKTPTAKPTKVKRRGGSTLRNSKRRKVDDVLNSFV